MTQPLTRNDLHGFVPAAVTPFSPAGEILYEAFEAHVDWLIGIGATAICVAGDNGESWTLDVDERRRLTEAARRVAAGRVPVLTGATAAGAGQSVRYAAAAAEGGADGLLLMPQTYVLKATRAELMARYEAVARSVDLPIVAYNSPRRVGFSMSMDDLEAVTGVAPIIGIKESHRDFFHHTELLERFASRMSVMVGPCHYILPGLALGARGFIATGPELLGRDAGRITALAAEAPGPPHAATHFRLTTIYRTLISTGTWPAAFKAALGLIGQDVGVPRDPVQPLAGEELDRIRAMIAALRSDA